MNVHRRLGVAVVGGAAVVLALIGAGGARPALLGSAPRPVPGGQDGKHPGSFRAVAAGPGGAGQPGVGVYWTNDVGTTWTRSTGVPTSSFSFKVTVDPTNPAVVFVANSKGLYRSGDAGRTFANVGLPTTCTDLSDHKCFLA